MSAWTFQTWVEHELDNGALDGVTPSNSGRKALWAAYAARLGLGARTEAFDLVATSTGYWAPHEGDVSSAELARAARAAWLLLPMSTDEGDGVRAWFEAMEPRRAYERGAFNRAIDDGLFLEMCDQVGAQDPLRDGLTYRQRAELNWADWNDLGDITEDSANYMPYDLSRLVWWAEARGGSALSNVRTLADRAVAYMTPLGPIPHFGDDIGLAGNIGPLIGALGRLASLDDDAGYAWAASKMFGFVAARRDEIEASLWDSQYRRDVMEGLFDALLDDQPVAQAPVQSSAILQRKRIALDDYSVAGEQPSPRFVMTSEDVPDKLILRHDQSYAMVNLTPRAGHGHPEVGGIVGYVHDGAVLLTGSFYQDNEPEDHNVFAVKAYGQDEPLNVHQFGAFSPSFTATGVVTITFDARSISGSRLLTVRRSFATTNAHELCVRLSEVSQTFTVTLDLDALTSPPHTLTFSLAEDYTSDTVAGGTFALENVTVVQGEDEVLAWPGPGEFTIASDNRVVRYSGEVESAQLVTSHGLPYARVVMRRHFGMPVDVTREFVMRAGGALLVKDVATVTEDFHGEMGPRWQVAPRARVGTWDICRRETVEVRSLGGTNLLTWDNGRAKMLRLVESLSGGADGIVRGTFHAGDELAFTSQLVPASVKGLGVTVTIAFRDTESVLLQ